MLNYDYSQYQDENGNGFDFGSLDPYQYRTAQVESQLGQDNHTYSGSNQGIYQWGSPERQTYGISDIRNPWQNLTALNRESDLNSRAFQNRFGRAPSPGELYLMHQQGQAGGMALMGADPNTPATQAIGRYYRDGGVAAITGNGGNRNMTAGDFSNYWIKKFENDPKIASYQIPNYNTQAGAPMQVAQATPSPAGPSLTAATAPVSNAAPPPQPALAPGSGLDEGGVNDPSGAGSNPAMAKALLKAMDTQPLQPAPMPQFQLAPHMPMGPQLAARLRNHLAQLSLDDKA